MSAGLTILLVVAAWALGPLILRCAGGLMTTTAVVLWAIPMRTHTSATALIVTAVSGAAAWYTGTTWQARRHTARSANRNAPPGRELIADGIRLLRQSRNTPDTYQQGGETYPINERDPGNTPPLRALGRGRDRQRRRRRRTP